MAISSLVRSGDKQSFLQEAKAASALDHPDICTIYEINETADGQLYLVMAHYEGETLKERIGRGPLELKDAIDIASSRAHERFRHRRSVSLRQNIGVFGASDRSSVGDP